MKYAFILALAVVFSSFSAFAEGEASTDCPMMRESNRRANTKLNLSNSQKPGHVKGSKGRDA